MSNTVITRFAPSPTGFLHIGSARTALFCWAYAKKHNGTMLLRIEDTDRKRSTQEATDAILDGLKWLGINWDGDPISQNDGMARHAEVAAQMVKDGTAYYCYCSPEELTKMRERARAEGRPPQYDRRWRDKAATDAPEGISPVVRIKSPLSGDIIVNDHVQGDVVFNAKNIDDFIILRSDGSPTYMLAVVVDDHDMGVTHIIRGDDHLTNSARQSVIYQAMGWDVPQTAHISLIHGPDGAKLSKRHGALGVDAYRQMGYLPEAVSNYLARLGWAHGDDEIFDIEQFVAWFGFSGMNKGAARFDFAKLENINAHYIREAVPVRLFEAMHQLAKELGRDDDATGLLANQDTVLIALPDLQPRAKTVLDLIALAQFIYAARPLTIEDKAQKHLSDDSRTMIGTLVTAFGPLEDWKTDGIGEIVRAHADANALKLGKVAQPLRVALTGRTISPGVFEVMQLLGKTESLARLKDQAKP